jgi:hypothetical protein
MWYNTQAGCNLFVEISFFRKDHCTILHTQEEPARRSVTDINKLCPQLNINVQNAQNEVSEWLYGLEMTE